MRRYSILRVAFAVHFAIPVIGQPCSGICLGQGTGEAYEVLPVSAVRFPVTGETTFRIASDGIQWDGQTFSRDDGIRALMRVILDSGTVPGVRVSALSRLPVRLETDIAPQLISLYEDLSSRDEKVAVVACLTRCDDPRGLPLFVRILGDEKNNSMRFVAAVALARWNVRRGVAELVSLFDSKDRLDSDRVVGEEAIGVFVSLSRSKHWDLPVGKIRETVEQEKDLSRDASLVRYAHEITAWFEQNKRRFPTWKSGDPLPDTASEATDDRAEK